MKLTLNDMYEALWFKKKFLKLTIASLMPSHQRKKIGSQRMLYIFYVEKVIQNGWKLSVGQLYFLMVIRTKVGGWQLETLCSETIILLLNFLLEAQNRSAITK